MRERGEGPGHRGAARRPGHPGNADPRVVWNGALVPSNGHARSSGYIGELCGQALWEAVEGYPVGDLRFVEVGPAQDRDEQLGCLITPFRFGETGPALIAPTKTERR